MDKKFLILFPLLASVGFSGAFSYFELNNGQLQTDYIINASAYYGDGGNLTNISNEGDGYAGDIGHPHDQDLNTTNDIVFSSLELREQSNFHAYDTSSQSVPFNTPTKIQIDTEDYDILSEFDTTNNRFEPDSTGYYLMGYRIAFQSVPSTKYVECYIREDDATQHAYSFLHSSFSGDLCYTGCEIIKVVDTNEYFELYARVSGTIGNINTIADYCIFWGYKLP